jgi:lysophospholipase L1-like esterase
VYSVYQRLRAANPHVNIQPVNLAEPGAGADYLYIEAMAAVERQADYVTILIGANDACRWPMTDPQTFRADIDYALEILEQRRPRPRIALVSIPDVVNLWTLAHDHLLAMLAWQFMECPSLMANAASTASADVHRRQSIGRRIQAYNRELRGACKEYGNRCHWDRGRAHRVKFTLELVGLDYFHPNLRGQQELAKAPLPAGWTSK